jgi:hypothetical protein
MVNLPGIGAASRTLTVARLKNLLNSTRFANHH